MANRSLTVSLGSVPRWVALVGIIIASRIVSSGILLWFAGSQAENPWTAARPDLVEFSRIWDSHWYRIIAEIGYPSELPRDDNGRVGENAWAFMPVYPFVVRGFMAVTSLPFSIVSIVVSIASFAGFILVADRLFRRLVGERAALAAVAVISFAPVAPIFQVGYAESMGMFFLALILVGLVERRWWLVGVLLPVAALTRPLGVPLALALFVITVFSWKSAADRKPLMLLTTLAGVSAALWPVIAGVVTGQPSAYVDTELAWRRPYVGDSPHRWGTGWWDSANWWFPDSAPWVIGGLGVVVVVIAALPATRRLGLVALAWSGSFLAYLVIVLFPQSSIFRLLMPLFPLAGVVSRNRVTTLFGVVAGVVGQFFWVKWCWAVDSSDWTPP